MDDDSCSDAGAVTTMPHGPACQTPCYCFTPALPPLCAPATQQVILLDWQSEETSHLYSTMSASGSKYVRQIRNAVCNYSVCKQLISFTAAHYKGLPHFRVHPHTLQGSPASWKALLEGVTPSWRGQPPLRGYPSWPHGEPTPKVCASVIFVLGQTHCVNITLHHVRVIILS